MSEVDLSQYYSAGYFLIRANDPGWDLPDIFPDQLISLSGCICPKLELTWGWNQESEYALEFGIPAEKFDAFVTWCKRESEADWSMFYSAEAARKFVNQFMVDTENLYLIGLGFPREIEEIGWRGTRVDDEDYGIKQRISQHLPLNASGDILGHEIVSFEAGRFGHSWICNHIYEEPFGFALNQHGFISKLGDARKVYDWIAEDDMQGLRGEPEPYYIWLLVSYPLRDEEVD